MKLFTMKSHFCYRLPFHLDITGGDKRFLFYLHRNGRSWIVWKDTNPDLWKVELGNASFLYTNRLAWWKNEARIIINVSCIKRENELKMKASFEMNLASERADEFLIYPTIQSHLICFYFDIKIKICKIEFILDWMRLLFMVVHVLYLWRKW